MHSGSDSHFAEELLEKYSVGQLSDGQTALIEEHLLICFECQVRLSGIDEYALATRTAAAELKAELGPRKPRLAEFVFGRSALGPFRIPTPVWAAGVAVLAVVLLIPYRPAAVVQSEIALSAPRGGESALIPHASSRSKILLKIATATLPASPAYQVRVVDANGREVWRGSLISRNTEMVAMLPETLGTGQYWVRVFSASDLKLLQEYGLSVD